MNVKAISASVIGVLLFLTVVMIRQPAVPVVPGAQGASDDGPHARSHLRAEPAQAAARAGNVNAAMVARLESLETEIKRLDQTRELDELRSRVAQLERSMRNSRQADPASRSQTSDIDQLKRENASLKRAHEQLASQVARAENKSNPAINDLRVLQQKVFSLETAVQRLQSR